MPESGRFVRFTMAEWNSVSVAKEKGIGRGAVILDGLFVTFGVELREM